MICAFILTAVTGAGTIQGIEVYLTPFVCYDEGDGTKLEGIFPHRDLARELGQFWFNNLVTFKTAQGRETYQIQSVVDAERRAAELGTGYVIYGYLKKSAGYWFMEGRIYDAGRKVVEYRFYGSDEEDQYERMIEAVGRNLRDYYYGKAGRPAGAGEEVKEFALRLPVGAGYWTYVNKGWVQSIVGVTEVRAGLEVFPELQLPVFHGKRHELSAGITADYRYGIGNPDRYAANMHAVQAGLPVTYYFELNEAHRVGVSVMPFYEADILEVVEKYEEAAAHVLSLGGVDIGVRYRYKVNERFTIDGELGAGIFFMKDTAPVVRATVGSTVTLVRREKRYSWGVEE
jgi:hypothetical protein